jgi:PelA/Pel-15E family pectate lyase
MLRISLAIVLAFTVATSVTHAADDISKAETRTALRKAVGFFRSKVSVGGGYLWRYSDDLARREGERKATAKTAWVQPPGTPSVGEALLQAFELTGDRYYLESARETAYALVVGQLQSGGWDYRIEFDPNQRRKYAYRVQPNHPTGRNVTTLDDNTTQSALRFLMRVDMALKFQDEKIHEAVEYALDSLLKAQYPNGSWAQRFSESPDPQKHPVRKASYPKTWSRTYAKKDYRGYYTFNDNSIADVIAVMFQASETYNKTKYTAAAEKAGDFILLAQLPEPQPAWSQQYDTDMHPAWARRFEPPSITGGESQGVMRTLLFLYRKTGKKKYLEPIPRAIAYLRKSELPDGRLARFYELQTNRPLYFVKDTYKLTYKSDNMPTHYGFIVGSKLNSIEAEHRRLLRTDPAKLDPRPGKRTYRLTPTLQNKANTLVARLDGRGAWVEQGTLKYHGPDDPTMRIIDSRTFATNVVTLAQFLAAE